MHRKAKQRESRTPLLVKEIILPYGQENSGSSKNITFCRNNQKVITESGHKITGHRLMKTGQHEREEVLSLMSLQEKPLENYFEGTSERKKIRSRKRKHHRVFIPLRELLSDGTQTLSTEERTQTGKTLTEEEKTEIHLMDLKIYEYEKMREQALKQNYVRQKMAEEDYICQLENLVAMWFKGEKRSHVTKKVDDDLVLPKSFPEKTPNKRTKEISFTSREYCNENPESPPGKSKKVFKEVCQPVQVQPTGDALGDELYEKLVFIDEDSD